MFNKITKIKAIKHLNASLKEAKLSSLYQQAIQQHNAAKAQVSEYHSYRLTTEKELISPVIGGLVCVNDIDLLNEKLSGLRATEVDLKMRVREKEQTEKQAYNDWQAGKKALIQAQKSVDKFEYITEIQAHKDSLHTQYLEDLELEEFKPIKALECSAL